ncbi:MAG: hypothetical protein GEV06_00505 [Luteitalea sp.]|nr:hypothetical protein [Luteitalea sp.]
MPSRFASMYLFAVCATVIAGAAASERPQGSTSEMPAAPPRVHNREASTATEGNREIVQLDEREGDGVAWWPDLVLGDGTIEIDIRGRDIMARSFVGVAFHGVDEETYDAVYFRPFNFKAPDPVRRSHGVQYIAHRLVRRRLQRQQPVHGSTGHRPCGAVSDASVAAPAGVATSTRQTL